MSLLLELGTPPHVVEAIAPHADLDTTLAIYAYTNLLAICEVLDKIDCDVGRRRLLHEPRWLAQHGRSWL